MVYVTGDMHGDPARLRTLKPLKKGDTLVVCGDFGFLWSGSAAERKLLNRLGKQKKYTIAFLDGRHENFDLLAEYPVTEWNGGRVRRINDRVVHLMRGEIYEIEGKSCFVFGGGESDDREFRVPGKSWWAAEMPNEEEMRRARENLAAHGDRVDCIFTHMPPRTCSARLNPKAATMDGVSLFLGTLEESVNCGHWYFGALHMDKPISRQRTAVFEKLLALE